MKRLTTSFVLSYTASTRGNGGGGKFPEPLQIRRRLGDAGMLLDSELQCITMKQHVNADLPHTRLSS